MYIKMESIHTGHVWQCNDRILYNVLIGEVFAPAQYQIDPLVTNVKEKNYTYHTLDTECLTVETALGGQFLYDLFE